MTQQGHQDAAYWAVKAILDETDIWGDHNHVALAQRIVDAVLVRGVDYPPIPPPMAPRPPPTGRCAKCGNWESNIGVEWHPIQLMDGRDIGWLNAVCRRCGYVWRIADFDDGDAA